MPEASRIIPIFLEPIDGPELKPVALRDASSATFGRSEHCTVVLNHHAVSREHMALTTREDKWFATDHASRNGTRLNGFMLPVGEPTPLADADHLQVGPWTFRVRLGEPGTRSSVAMLVDDARTSERLLTTGVRGAEPRLRQQFSALLRASALLYSARDEGELLDRLLQTAQSATGFERVAIVRRTESIDSVEVVAQRTRDAESGRAPDAFHFSRSLLRAASSEPFAVVTEGLMNSVQPETLARLDIAAAACAPIRLNEAVWGYLYLDSGAGAPPTGTDELLDLTRSVADIASLALERVKQIEVSTRLRALQTDLEAAAEIQRFLLPPPEGRFGPLSYAMRNRPGRMVTGDIFDVIDLGDGRIAALLGDVMGKGMGAGLVMSSAQSYLHSALRNHEDPGEVLELLNAYLFPRMPSGRFASLWLGIIDAERGRLVAADAGHGYSVLVRPGGGAEPVRCSGGTPVGAQEHCSYGSTAIDLVKGSRLVLFSDGIIEQRSLSGEPYGLGRLLELISSCSAPPDEVSRIVSSVEAYAKPAAPSDDLTAASFLLS